MMVVTVDHGRRTWVTTFGSLPSPEPPLMELVVGEGFSNQNGKKTYEFDGFKHGTANVKARRNTQQRL